MNACTYEFMFIASYTYVAICMYVHCKEVRKATRAFVKMLEKVDFQLKGLP